MDDTHPLDEPNRFAEIRARIDSKPCLRAWYRECYAKFSTCLAHCPPEGDALELGSGAGFAKEHIPDLITSDTLPYPGVDRVLDATALPFEAGSLRALFLLNAFHHIADVEKFFDEARRCLRPGGRMLIIDEHPGWLSHWILRYGHHEGYAPGATDWQFDSSGPLSDANGALAWIVFQRDRERFEQSFPELRTLRYETHTPTRYWLAGGLKAWSLAPAWGFRALTGLDRFLVRIAPELGSFVDIELERV